MFDNASSTVLSSAVNSQTYVSGLGDPLMPNTQLNQTFTGSSTKYSASSLQTSAQAIATNAFTIQPDLIVNAFSVPTTASPNSYLNFNYTVQNQGNATATSHWTYFYLSTDRNFDANIDTLIGQDSVNSISAGGSSSEYASNYVSSANVANGNYYVIARVDGANQVIESNESNNITVSSNTIQIGATNSKPDLTINAFSVPTTASPNSYLNFNYTVQNQGTAISGLSDTYFFVSTDQILDANDQAIGYDSVNSIGAGGASSEYASSYISNIAAGNYYVIAKADLINQVTESNESNNITVSSNTVQIGNSRPDLIVAPFSVPTTASSNSYLNFNYTVKNQGTASANLSFTRFYLSTDQILDTATDKFIVDDYVGAISAGGFSSESVNEYGGNYLSGVASGTYYIIAKADGPGVVGESNESNNITVSSNTVKIGSGSEPDLTINAFSIPTTASNSGYLNFNYTVKNQGTTNANYSYTYFYLSTDQTLNTSTDTYIGTDYVTSIGAGGSSNEYISNYLSGIASGTYYIIAQADIYGQIIESNESNNITVSSNTVQIGSTSSQPDLTVGYVNIAVNVWNNGYLYSNYTINNQGTTTANPSYTKFYLSTDKTLDTNTDKFIGYDSTISSIAAGATLGKTFAFSSYASSYNLPSGSYYLIAQADGYNYVTESNESNNVANSSYSVWLT